MIGLKNTYQDVARRLAGGLETGTVALEKDDDLTASLWRTLLAWLAGSREPQTAAATAARCAESSAHLRSGLETPRSLGERAGMDIHRLQNGQIVIDVEPEYYQSLESMEQNQFIGKVKALRQSFPHVEVRLGDHKLPA